MRIIGIDGGVSGAVAFIDDDRCGYVYSEVWDTPTFTCVINGKERRQLDPAGFKRHCQDRAFGLDLVLFEEGQGVREQSGAASYKYGFVDGQMVGVVATLGLRYELVRPVVWKRALGLIKKSKDDSRRLATQLYPELERQFARVKDDGRAEALLIAHYGLKRTV